MFNFFKKKAKRIIRGLTSSEVYAIRDAIMDEYDEAHERQKNPDAKPNQYMVGLLKALDILSEYEVHDIAEVR